MLELSHAEPLRIGDRVSYEGYSRKPGTVAERLSGRLRRESGSMAPCQ